MQLWVVSGIVVEEQFPENNSHAIGRATYAENVKNAIFVHKIHCAQNVHHAKKNKKYLDPRLYTTFPTKGSERLKMVQNASKLSRLYRILCEKMTAHEEIGREVQWQGCSPNPPGTLPPRPGANHGTMWIRWKNCTLRKILAMFHHCPHPEGGVGETVHPFHYHIFPLDVNVPPQEGQGLD